VISAPMLGAKAVTFIILDPLADPTPGRLPDPLTNWCRPGWHGGAPSQIRPQKYLHQMAQKCKPGQVDPFFTKTGSKVGLAWLENDST